MKLKIIRVLKIHTRYPECLYSVHIHHKVKSINNIFVLCTWFLNHWDPISNAFLIPKFHVGNQKTQYILYLLEDYSRSLSQLYVCICNQNSDIILAKTVC